MQTTPHDTPPVNLEWLRTFAVFAEQLNFTRAAEILHLSQPAVHGQVRKLSDQLGATLYRRVGRRLELTAEGRSTRAFAGEALTRSARFLDDLRGLAHGPVVLAAGEGSLLYLLGAPIRRFVERPGARLRLEVGDAAATVDAVLTHRAHVGVAPVNEPPPELEVRPLTTVGLHVVVPAGDALARRSRVTVGDLAHSALIVPPPGRAHRARLAAALDRAGVPWTVAVEVSGWPLMLRAVELGLGRAVVNDCCPPPPGAVAVPLDGSPRRTWYAVRRHATQTPPEARLWADLLGAFVDG